LIPGLIPEAQFLRGSTVRYLYIILILPLWSMKIPRVRAQGGKIEGTGRKGMRFAQYYA
jgi:hypothetical protein